MSTFIANCVKRTTNQTIFRITYDQYKVGKLQMNTDHVPEFLKLWKGTIRWNGLRPENVPFES